MKMALPDMLRSLIRILSTVAIFVGAMIVVRKMFALLIPSVNCLGTPIEPVIYVLSLVFFMHLAAHDAGSSFHRWVRAVPTMFISAILAVLATRFLAGCTPVAQYFPDGRVLLQALLMNMVLVPLAHLHRHVIEPRWARAMGEKDQRPPADRDGN